MKTAFATCVQLGRGCIEEIYRIGGKLELLITLKDERAKNKSGRIYLDDLAQSWGIPLLKIDNINELCVINTLQEMEIDWLFIPDRGAYPAEGRLAGAVGLYSGK